MVYSMLMKNAEKLLETLNICLFGQSNKQTQENKSNFKSWGVTLVTGKKGVLSQCVHEAIPLLIT